VRVELRSGAGGRAGWEWSSREHKQFGKMHRAHFFISEENGLSRTGNSKTRRVCLSRQAFLVDA
jgi:hypothetical protein